MLDKDSEEYKEWKKDVEKAIKGTLDEEATFSTIGCLFVDALGALGVCSAINAAAVGGTYATRLAAAEAAVARTAADLKRISDRMVESGDNFEQALNVAIAVLQNEIEIIGRWTQSAKTVSDNIEEYSVELLRLLKPLRTIFVTGLDNLKKAAEEFLAQPKNILTLEDVY